MLGGLVWGVQCSALWDRPCRALPKVCGGQECRASKCAVSTHTCSCRVMGLMLVYVPCVRAASRHSCMCGSVVARSVGLLSAVSTHTCACRVMGLMLVYVPCVRGGESTLLYVCWVRLVYALCVRGGESSLWLGIMCGLGDRAGTHPRGVASAVFPNLYSTIVWWNLVSSTPQVVKSV